MDLFVVNSYGSAFQVGNHYDLIFLVLVGTHNCSSPISNAFFITNLNGWLKLLTQLIQALFICILLPFLSKLWGIPFIQLPNYLRDGAACFLNIGTLSNGKLSFFLLAN